MKKSTAFIILLISVTFLAACGSSVSKPANTSTDTTAASTDSSRPTMGNPDAPILVEEFSDFQCPACATVTPQLEEVISKNPDIAKYIYHHYPLPYHQFGFKSAEAGECANEQGKFWEFAKMAFEDQESLTDDNLKSFAATLGLDTEKFNKCFDSGSKKDIIQADIADGNSRQLSYTPSIYVNGTLVQWTNAEDFEGYLKSLKGQE
jgi:protein-disulfide isomerase